MTGRKKHVRKVLVFDLKKIMFSEDEPNMFNNDNRLANAGNMYSKLGNSVDKLKSKFEEECVSDDDDMGPEQDFPSHRNKGLMHDRDLERSDGDKEFSSPKKRLPKGENSDSNAAGGDSWHRRPVENSWASSSSETTSNDNGWAKIGRTAASRDNWNDSERLSGQEKENTGDVRTVPRRSSRQRPPPPKASRPTKLQQQQVRKSHDFEVEGDDDDDAEAGSDLPSWTSKADSSRTRSSSRKNKDSNGSGDEGDEEVLQRRDAVESELLVAAADEQPAPRTPEREKEESALEGKALDPAYSPSFRDQAALANAEGIVLPSRSGRYSVENTPDVKARDDDAESVASSVEEMDMSVPAGRSQTEGGLNDLGFSPGSKPSRGPSFVLVAHPQGERSQHVQCLIVREKTSTFLNMLSTGGKTKAGSAYRLILEDTKKLLLVAKKMGMNRKSNYHMFDMTRGMAGSTANLTKKSGNYIGKLRATNMNRSEYKIVTKSSQKEQIGTIAFDRPGLVSSMTEGSQPRRMYVTVPNLDANNVPKSVPDADTKDAMGFEFTSKDPVFEKGNYRLNFKGRVSVASVKNFQLVSPDEIDNIVCQFGKIGEDSFHLDFKAPLNAIQAFALALAQFNL